MFRENNRKYCGQTENQFENGNTRHDSHTFGKPEQKDYCMWLPWHLFVQIMSKCLNFVEALSEMNSTKVENVTQKYPFGSGPKNDSSDTLRKSCKSVASIMQTVQDINQDMNETIIIQALNRVKTKLISYFDNLELNFNPHQTTKPWNDNSVTPSPVQGTSLSLHGIMAWIRRLVPECVHVMLEGIQVKHGRKNVLHKQRFSARLWVLVGSLHVTLALPNSIGDPIACKIAECVQATCDLAQVTQAQTLYAMGERPDFENDGWPTATVQHADPKCTEYTLVGLQQKERQLRASVKKMEATVSKRSIRIKQNSSSSSSLRASEDGAYSLICETLYSFLASVFPFEEIMQLSASMMDEVIGSSTCEISAVSSSHFESGQHYHDLAVKETRFQHLSQQLIISCQSHHRHNVHQHLYGNHVKHKQKKDQFNQISLMLLSPL
jgi:hypothetical protein